MNAHSATSDTSTASVAMPAAEQVLQIQGVEAEYGFLPIQCQLTVGSPDDPLEDEADEMADRVMRMPDPGFVQRKCAECEEDDRVQRNPITSFIQRKESSGDTAVNSSTANDISNAKGSGSSLNGQTKSFMENRFGADFSEVKIHTDSEASQLSHNLNAQAFTVGKDVFFNTGKFAPDTAEGGRLLAHELTHTIQQSTSVQRQLIQRDDTPSATHYLSLAQLLPKTISQFMDYIHTQADWFSASTLSEDDREEVQYLVLFANEDIQAVFPSRTVQQFYNLFNTDGELADERAGRLHAYAAAASARKYPFEISNFAANLTQAIAIGADIKRLLEGFPDWVLHTAMKEQEFRDLRTNNFIPDLLAYYTTAAQRPTFQADNGTDFASFILFRQSGVSPLHYDSTTLLNRVRNYHRFERAALDRLVTNFADTGKTLPLTLILHTALDHNGAFHRDPNLTAVITNNTMLTLMVEGFETLEDVQSQIQPLAEGYGINNHIDQLMFAGHGNARSIQLAGTVEESVNDAGAHQLSERSDSLNLNTNQERSEHIIDAVLAYMDNDTTDPAARQPRTRVVFNACLTGSNAVRESIGEGDVEAAKTHVRTYIHDHASLATFLDTYAEAHGAAGLASIGSNASFGQVQLINGANALDIISPATATSIGDPAITASKLEYVERGNETAGALRAVLESWASHTADTLDAMRRRLGRTESNNWNVLLIRKAYQLILANYAADAEKIRLVGASSEPLAELHSANNCNIENNNRQGANSWAASSSTDEFYADLIGSVTPAAEFTGSLRVRLSILQLWLMKDSAKDASFMTALAGTTVNNALNFVDISFLEDNNNTLERLFTSTDDAAKLRLALIGVLGSNANERCKNYLISLLAGGTAFPASLHIETALGGAASASSVIDTLGVNAPPPSTSTGSSTPTPTHTANIRLHGETGNTLFVNPIHQYMEFEGYLVFILHERPDAASRSELDENSRGAYYVIGETADWYAVQHTYEGESIPSAAFIRKRTGPHISVRNLNP